jgi:hypothetical protein
MSQRDDVPTKFEKGELPIQMGNLDPPDQANTMHSQLHLHLQ